MNRRPVLSAIAAAPIYALVGWLISRDLASTITFAAAVTVGSELGKRSEYSRRGFARWADKHPYPSS
jgi:hypothetical protein